MAESEVPVYTTDEHFQGPDAHNAEQTRAEIVSVVITTTTPLVICYKLLSMLCLSVVSVCAMTSLLNCPSSCSSKLNPSLYAL